MRFLAIAVSLITLLYLALGFMGEDDLTNTSDNNEYQYRIIEPSKVNEAPLVVETEWEKLKKERAAQKAPKEAADDLSKNKDVLTLNNRKYIVYGIFNANVSVDNSSEPNGPEPFILIKAIEDKNNNKAPDNGLMKIMKNEVLSEGIILVNITSDTVTFENAGELIDFNLFDPK